MARGVDCDRSVRELGGGRRRCLRRRLNAWASIAVDLRIRACARPSVNRTAQDRQERFCEFRNTSGVQPIAGLLVAADFDECECSSDDRRRSPRQAWLSVPRRSSHVRQRPRTAPLRLKRARGGRVCFHAIRAVRRRRAGAAEALPDLAERVRLDDPRRRSAASWGATEELSKHGARRGVAAASRSLTSRPSEAPAVDGPE